MLSWGLAGCGGGRGGDAALSGGAGEDYWGEVAAGSSGPAPAGGPAGDAGGAVAATGPERVWTIVLNTFSEGDHAIAAARSVLELPRIAPELRGAWVHSTDDGSKVLYGRYAGPDDPGAQRDLKWVKGLTWGDVQVFSRAMLVPVTLRPERTADPMHLSVVRQRYPKVDPLYTLQVAVWSDFGSSLTGEQIREAARAYCRKLRSQGFPAYYYHDEEKLTSIVTVGLFGRDALDPRTGLYSVAVEEVLEKFPEHLVNGEPFNEPIYASHPSRGTRVQKPRLVQVPEF